MEVRLLINIFLKTVMDLGEIVSARSVMADKCFFYSANEDNKFMRKISSVRRFLECFKFGVRL